MPDVPQQFSVPFRFENGKPAVTEQGTSRELADRVTVLCHTPPGWLDGREGFGLADQRFRRGGADLLEIEQQITEWVPDAAKAVEQDLTALDEGLAFVGVQVRSR